MGEQGQIVRIFLLLAARPNKHSSIAPASTAELGVKSI